MVITIHDLMPERWPELSSPQQLAGRSQAIRDAHRIVCVSESTRTLLAEWYPESEHKATTVHLGVPDYVLTQPLTVEAARAVDARYLVYVGNRGHYKNFATLAAAMLLDRYNRFR